MVNVVLGNSPEVILQKGFYARRITRAKRLATSIVWETTFGVLPTWKQATSYGEMDLGLEVKFSLDMEKAHESSRYLPSRVASETYTIERFGRQDSFMFLCKG
jgi:hypothetical protein